ncbi:MAG: four helix bundle protein [Bacteroidetes bacterium]|nr:four helix bundle protein [Bacteroidota bacterium]
MSVRNFKETAIYKKAFVLAMEIFAVSKSFPKEERYSLTDQIRRSSRSVCANLSEAYRKRQYPAHFVSKISDCDAENSETGVWLDFSFNCDYINENTYKDLIAKNEEVGKLLTQLAVSSPRNR